MKSGLVQFTEEEINQLIDITGGLPERVSREYFTEVLCNGAAKPSYVCMCYSIQCMPKQNKTLSDLKRITKSTKHLIEDLSIDSVVYSLEKIANEVYSGNSVYEFERIVSPILDVTENLKELHSLASQVVKLKEKVTTADKLMSNGKKKHDGDPIILSAIKSLLEIWRDVLKLDSGISVNTYTNTTDAPIIKFILRYLEILSSKMPDTLLAQCPSLQKALSLSNNAIRHKIRLC